MTDTQILSNEFRRYGNDLSELKAALNEMDAMTSLLPVNTLDVDILSLDKGKGMAGGKIPFRVFQPLNGETSSVVIPLEDAARKEKLASLVRELKENRMLLRIGGKLYFTATDLMNSMSTRAGLGGSNLSMPSNRRDAYIAELFGKDDKDIQVIVRKSGTVQKVFAMHSEEYTRVPQITLLEIIQQIEHGLGFPVCRFWEVDHDHAYVQLDFPEKAKDFARVYGISDGLIPGLRLATSDVAKSSVSAVGTWRIGGGIVRLDTYSRKHVSKITSETILKEIKASIFLSSTPPMIWQ
jgi:hypothetical protein